MKKVKLMLMSLALFAVVGAGLAFKAKLSAHQYCTIAADESSVCANLTCPVSAGFAEPDGSGNYVCTVAPILYTYTTVPNGETFESVGCAINTNLPTNYATTTLTCVGSPIKLKRD